MKPLNTVVAFASGCLVTVAIGWVAVDVVAQENADEAIHVCVAADGVLRILATCPPGQKDLYLARAVAGNAQEKGSEASKSESLRRALADLEERVTALEELRGNGELARRVVAPFEVVDRAGKRIFLVDEDHRVKLFNSSGKVVALISASDSGAYFQARSATTDLVATIGASGNATGLIVQEGGGERLNLGREPETGTYRVKFSGMGGKLVAGIGISKLTGGGNVTILDDTGKVRVVMGVDSEKRGVIETYGKNATVTRLTEGETGGGKLEIFGSNGGQALVEAGVAPQGYGVVRAGPEGFKGGAGGFLGLPASYLVGKP